MQDVSGRHYRPGRQCEPYLPPGFRLESLAAFLAGFPIQFYYIALWRRDFDNFCDNLLDEEHPTSGL